MNKNIYKLIWAILIGLAPMVSHAQAIKVTGQVVDMMNAEGIPGATILIQGTTVGTVTDIDGNYSLNVDDPNVTLLYSFVGYDDVQEVINGRSTIDVILSESLTQLSEVVVIGYGTQKKKVVTGAIASVSAEDISSIPVLRLESALQGRTPGVQVTQLSGQPGETPTIRIRGAGTTGNATPLYVVDGMPIDNIEYLNPGDIESMDVLKDAASAAIYGARAANGVVLITTKSGVKGKMSISYSGYYGVQNVARKVDMLNSDQFKILMNEGARNGNKSEPFDLNEVPAHNTDWQSALFQDNAPISNHQISVTGGNSKSTYASSLSYFSQQGIIGGDKSQFDRFTARINSTHQVLDRLKFGTSMTYTHIIRRGVNSNGSFYSPYGSALNMDPLTPVIETDPDILSNRPYSTDPVLTDENGNVYGISTIAALEVVNPLALIENDHQETRKDELVGNIYGELEILKGLKLRSSLGIDLAYVLDDNFGTLYYLNYGTNELNNTSVSKSIARYYTWQFENTLNYTKSIGDHNLGVLAGISSKEDNFENLTGSNKKVPVIDYNNVYLSLAEDTTATAYGGAARNSIYSLFGRLTYDYKDKYSVTAILRRDGSSKFGSNKKFGIFPSLGVAWVMSDEAFLQNLGPVNFLKLRASWGINGNEKIGSHQYTSVLSNTRGYIFGGGKAVGVSPEYLENQDIHWEESEQYNVALDLGLLENRLTANLDYYVKTTHGLLERISIPGHVGVGAPIANVGSVQNRGIEIATNWKSRVGDLRYTVGINATYNINEVTEIANPNGFINGASWGIQGTVTRSEEGMPIAYFWGLKTDGIFQNNAEVFQHIGPEGMPIQPDAVPGDVRFVDVDNDGVINDNDRTMIGNPTPDWTGGLTATLNYKSFDFSLLVTGAFGHQILNGATRMDLQNNNRSQAFFDNRWTGEGTSNEWPRYTWDDSNGNYQFTDLNVEDASYVRIKNIQFGYTLPQSLLDKMGASVWRFYVSAENVMTFTGYSGADPEIGAMSSFDIGIDRAIYPQARTFRVGTTLTF